MLSLPDQIQLPILSNAALKLPLPPSMIIKLGQGFLFFDQSFIPAENNFFHCRKIINARHRFYIVMAVIIFTGNSVFETNHRRYRKASLEI